MILAFWRRQAIVSRTKSDGCAAAKRVPTALRRPPRRLYDLNLPALSDVRSTSGLCGTDLKAALSEVSDSCVTKKIECAALYVRLFSPE